MNRKHWILALLVFIVLPLLVSTQSAFHRSHPPRAQLRIWMVDPVTGQKTLLTPP